MSLQKADNAAAPIGNTTDAAYRNRLFTCTTSNAVNAVPKEWEGQFVTLLARGGDCSFFFSAESTAEVVHTQTATASGEVASPATLGFLLPQDSLMHVIVPASPRGSRIYFVREGSAAGSVYAFLRSGR